MLTINAKYLKQTPYALSLRGVMLYLSFKTTCKCKGQKLNAKKEYKTEECKSNSLQMLKECSHETLSIFCKKAYMKKIGISEIS